MADQLVIAIWDGVLFGIRWGIGIGVAFLLLSICWAFDEAFVGIIELTKRSAQRRTRWRDTDPLKG